MNVGTFMCEDCKRIVGFNAAPVGVTASHQFKRFAAFNGTRYKACRGYESLCTVIVRQFDETFGCNSIPINKDKHAKVFTLLWYG